MDFEKYLREILPLVSWKIVAGTIAALVGFILSLRALKVYAFFFAVLAAALALLWHLDWLYFHSLTDLALATLLIGSLNSLSNFLSRGSLIVGIILNGLVFLFVIWLVPGMSSKSPLLAMAIYTAIANGLSFVATGIFAESFYGDHDDDMDY